MQLYSIALGVAAQAEVDLAHIRRVKVALIERMFTFGEFESPREFESTRALIRLLNAIAQGIEPIPKPDAASTMPSTESERSAEAIRRALPELRKFDRYERHAAALRERSVRAIFERTK